jgi:NAD-dependent SIR2 family protein deacetylase
MTEWLDHMKAVHSDQWTRKIHMTTWYCDIDHELIQFDDYGSFITHMRDPTNHANRQPPTDLQLEALSRNKQKVLVREEEYSCPLCDCVPDTIEPVIRTSNPKNVKELLYKHIAIHVKALAFISVPVLTSTDPDHEESSGTDNNDRRCRRREDSAASCPSRFDLDIRAISLSFTEDPQRTDLEIIADEVYEFPDTHETYLEDIGFDDYKVLEASVSEEEEDPILVHFARLQHPTVIPGDDLRDDYVRAQHVDNIRQALRDKKLVIIVGAGISLSATHPSPLRITWTGLILDGLYYLQENGFAATDNEDLNYYRRVLPRRNVKIQTVLLACSYLKAELDHNKQFPTWLESVFGSLHRDVTHPEILEALREFHKRGARLITTNYDDLLERYCNLQRVSRSMPEDVRKYGQGSLDGIFHIHGSFQDPKEVVLDPIGYYQLKTSDDVQDLLKTYLGHNTILFVGCGSGLEDPNFKVLLKWASSREENIPTNHYLFVRDRDNRRYNPFITLKYGRNYEDLVPYLNALLDDPADAFAAGTSDTKKTSTERVPGM